MVSRRPAPRRPGLVFPTVLAATVGGASILVLSASGALALHGGPAAAVPLSAPLVGVVPSDPGPGVSAPEAGTVSRTLVPPSVASSSVISPLPAATSRDGVPPEATSPPAGPGVAGAEPPVTGPTTASDPESADGGSPGSGPVAVAGLGADPTQAPTAADHSISVSGGGFDDASPPPADRGDLGSPRVVAAAGPTVSVIAEPSTGASDG